MVEFLFVCRGEWHGPYVKQNTSIKVLFSEESEGCLDGLKNLAPKHKFLWLYRVKLETERCSVEYFQIIRIFVLN